MEYGLTHVYIGIYGLACVVCGVIKNSHRATLKEWQMRLEILIPALAFIGYFYVFPQQSRDLLTLGVFAPFIISSNLAFWLRLFFSKTKWYRSIWTNEKLDEQEKLGVVHLDFERFDLKVPVKRGNFYTCSTDDEKLYLSEFKLYPIKNLEFLNINTTQILDSFLVGDEGTIESILPDTKIKVSIYQFENSNLNDKESVEKAIKKFLLMQYFLPDDIDRATSKKNISHMVLQPWDSSIPMCCLSYSSRYPQSTYHAYHSLHICSNNSLLELEFSVDHCKKNRRTQDTYRKNITSFIEKIRIEEKTDNLEYIKIDTSQINNLIIKTDFYDCFPNKSDFSNFLKEHAEDPVEWHIFENAPGFEPWLSQQYKKHCELYQSKRTQYIHKLLEENT